MQAQEEEETIEFLKIRLMARDREVSDFEAKIKKIDFRHARDLRQSKIAEERAKTLLKEQKNKIDKLTTQLKETQEQNRLLNMCLAELREQKQREVTDARMQYNNLKEEVRTYERILPTLTFLKDYGVSIEVIPPYEDVFILSRSLTEELSQLSSEFALAKKSHSQQIRVLRQNEDLLKTKKLEIQKNFKQTLSKILDLQQQISELKAINDQYQTEISEVKNEREVLEERGESLTATVKEYELKFQELERAYSYEMLTKEEEIRGLTQQQFGRYESEIQSLENRLELKDKMYLQQIEILQEEVYYLQGKMAEEKDHFQQNYMLLKNQIDRMREEVQTSREEHQDLKTLHEEQKQKLNLAFKTKEQLQQKIKLQEIKLEMLNTSEEHHQGTFSDDQMRKMEDLEQNYQDICQKYQIALSTIKTLEENNTSLQDQLVILKLQLSKKNTPQHHTLEVPQNLFNFGENYRKKSADYEQDTGFQNFSVENENYIRERKKSEELSKQLILIERQRDELREQSIDFKHRLSIYSDKEEKNENEINSLKKQSQSSKTQTMELQDKLSQLVLSIEEKEQHLTTQSKNYNFLKKKTESLQYQNSTLAEESKKDKQLIKTLREEIKQLKETTIQHAEKAIKQRKEFYLTYQTLKTEKEKMKNQLIVKEKILNQEVFDLKKKIEEKDYMQKKLITLQNDFEVICKENEKLKGQIKGWILSIDQVRKEKEMLSDALKKKQKESIMLEESLERERKERTLLAVPSLEKIEHDSKSKAFNKIYSVVTQKESQISFLQRQISDLKEELELMKISHHSKLETMEEQQNSYIQTIIEMKIRCAQSEMKASESQYLYSKLKKKVGMKENSFTMMMKEWLFGKYQADPIGVRASQYHRHLFLSDFSIRWLLRTRQ